MRKKEKEEKKKGVMMQMQWARGEEEGLPGSRVQRREMARERAAVAGGAAMGGRAAAARSDLRAVAAACVWRKKMGSPGLRRMEMREIQRNGLRSRR
ncbi:hypothetical protein MRB53_030541 [Persea americana]|uniref:Uncharacterized protein n=1 Tax=Persea americana TaxID=3435 RepID=A0ACC2KLX4_PERAE|nr:hypothetical protein MRB53_030541 [Persea americana]